MGADTLLVSHDRNAPRALNPRSVRVLERAPEADGAHLRGGFRIPGLLLGGVLRLVVTALAGLHPLG